MTTADLDFADSGFSDMSGSIPGSDENLIQTAFEQLENWNLHTNFPFNPVEDLWFTDSQVVVFQAEDYFFRVPVFLFLSKSPVFRHFYHGNASIMFSKYVYDGNDSNVIEKLGSLGCSIFKMLGVTANEVAMFLSALIDPEYFEGPPSKESLELILAIFNLAMKYEVNFLYRRALAHLERAYPSEIEEWDSREERSTFSVERQEFYSAISPSLTATLDLIQLCTTYDVLWILPSAFYECCLYEMKTILEHPKWNLDGPGSLSNDIKTKIICGYLAHKDETSRVLTFLHAHFPPCSYGDVCNNLRREELRKVCTVREQQRDSQDFLGKVWDAIDWDEFGSQGMCDSCLSMCMSLHKEFRKVSWNNLPALYGLADWATLRAKRLSSISF